MNNQLECFFFCSSKTKYIYDFPKPKSQNPKTQNESQLLQNPQHLTSTSNRNYHD